jgi:hypothetical protein
MPGASDGIEPVSSYSRRHSPFEISDSGMSAIFLIVVTRQEQQHCGGANADYQQPDNEKSLESGRHGAQRG